MDERPPSFRELVEAALGVRLANEPELTAELEAMLGRPIPDDPVSPEEAMQLVRALASSAGIDDLEDATEEAEAEAATAADAAGGSGPAAGGDAVDSDR